MIPRITNKLLKLASKEFDEWYGVKIPLKLLQKWSATVSYDDVKYFDTLSREKLSDFVADLVVKDSWPTGMTGKKKRQKFFDDFQKNGYRHGIKVDWDW